MNEKQVILEECVAGNIVNRDIIDIRSGVVLCQKGFVLTEESIEWIAKFLYSDIYILVDEWTKVWNIDEKTIATYETNKVKLNDLLQSLKDSKNININQLKEIKEDFMNELSNNSTIMGCVNIIKTVDEYTYAHCLNVGMLAVLMGRWLKLREEQIQDLFLAGILHDVGKYKVNPKIINKRGPLNIIEYAMVKKHVIYGYDLIKDMNNLSEGVKQGVLCHHERIDGTGYPRELSDKEIHLFGKVIAIADMYDAMISERVYKQRQTPFEVMDEMLKEGINKLDTAILLTFLKNIANYYIGVFVKLSTGDVGEVVFIHPHCVYRPIVKVGDNYIDLDTQKDIHIIDIV